MTKKKSKRSCATCGRRFVFQDTGLLSELWSCGIRSYMDDEGCEKYEEADFEKVYAALTQEINELKEERVLLKRVINTVTDEWEFKTEGVPISSTTLTPPNWFKRLLHRLSGHTWTKTRSRGK